MASSTARRARAKARSRRAPGRAAIEVVLVDPLRVVRAGLKLLIDEQPDIQVVAEAGDADEAMKVLGGLRRRTGVVVLVGLGLPGPHDAFWLIRTIRETFPWLVTLALGANADGMAISRALFVGADGYLDKGYEPDHFLDALREAARGELVLGGVPRDWLGAIAEGLERHREVAPLLTERELEVLTVAAEGLTAREIGRRLGVRERTVTTHLAHIYSKLGVGGRVGAVRAAARVGLVSVGGFE